MDVNSHFKEFFTLEHCLTQTTVSECKRLRYKIFCDELGFFSEHVRNSNLETDEYDKRSAHCLIRHNGSGNAAATVRLVLCDSTNEQAPYPIEKFEVLRRMERDEQWRVDRAHLAEISRFAIDSSFRRRQNEKDKVHGITQEIFKEYISERRKIGDLTLGLFKAVIEMSHEHQVTHWYAMMEPKLIRLLSRYGIEFNMVGPIFNHYGLRQPCIACVADVLNGIYFSRTDVWRFITDNGRHYGRSYLHDKRIAFT